MTRDVPTTTEPCDGCGTTDKPVFDFMGDNLCTECGFPEEKEEPEMKIDVDQLVQAYKGLREVSGLPEIDPARLPELEDELRKALASIEAVVELPDGKTVPLNKEEPPQYGDLRLHNDVEQVYCIDRGRWIKHDNPEWIAVRKASEQEVPTEEEPIITPPMRVKDLTPDQIKEMAETPIPLGGVLVRPVVQASYYTTATDPPECKRCNCDYVYDGHEPYDHGFCDPCASKELEEIRNVVEENAARYDQLRDSRMKYLKQVSELKRGVAYVALMKRIDELEARELDHIQQQEELSDRTQESLRKASKHIEMLEAANKAQGKHYRTQQKRLSERLTRRHKALVAAGVELEEKGEEITVSLLAWQNRRPIVFRGNPSSPGGDWCVCGAHIRFHYHAEGASHRCPTPDQLEEMNKATPGYGPVNEDPLIGPDLKPHDKMDREQLLAEVKRLEALPCKALCSQCRLPYRLPTEWWGLEFVCPSCQ